MRFSSLFCDFKPEPDEKGNLSVQKYVSLGRISFWICFVILAFFWFEEKPVPGSLYDVFFLMVLYNFFKKPIESMNPEFFQKFLTKGK